MTLGVRQGALWEIVEGLKGDETLANNRLNELATGMSVRIGTGEEGGRRGQGGRQGGVRAAAAGRAGGGGQGGAGQWRQGGQGGEGGGRRGPSGQRGGE